jgi:hypothetical protein
MTYFNQPTGTLENDFLSIEYLSQAGPRIVRLIYKAANINLLAETPDEKLKSPHGDYSIHGGHRFWAAPESPEFTYIPDDSGLKVENSVNSVNLIGAIEKPTGLQKTIEISLPASSPSVFLNHVLTNCSKNTIICAVWTITVLPSGGKAIMPLRGEPGSKLLPDRQISFWPYGKFTDPRFHLLDDNLTVDVTPAKEIFKVGARCPQGRLSYYNNNIVFRKEFSFNPSAHYPDFGCNAEIYTNGLIVELESLGGLVELKPGQSIHHSETWLIDEVP